MKKTDLTPTERLERYKNALAMITDWGKKADKDRIFPSHYPFGFCFALAGEGTQNQFSEFYPDTFGDMQDMYPEVAEYAPKDIKYYGRGSSRFWWNGDDKKYANKRTTILTKIIKKMEADLK